MSGADIKSPTTRRTDGLMKTPRRGLKHRYSCKLQFNIKEVAVKLKTLYSAVQYSLIINSLFLNHMTMLLREEIKNIVLSLFDTIEHIYSRRNGKTF